MHRPKTAYFLTSKNHTWEENFYRWSSIQINNLKNNDKTEFHFGNSPAFPAIYKRYHNCAGNVCRDQNLMHHIQSRYLHSKAKTWSLTAQTSSRSMRPFFYCLCQSIYHYHPYPTEKFVMTQDPCMIHMALADNQSGPSTRITNLQSTNGNKILSMIKTDRFWAFIM